jgi:hypothetical protein
MTIVFPTEAEHVVKPQNHGLVFAAPEPGSADDAVANEKPQKGEQLAATRDCIEPSAAPKADEAAGHQRKDEGKRENLVEISQEHGSAMNGPTLVIDSRRAEDRAIALALREQIPCEMTVENKVPATKEGVLAETTAVSAVPSCCHFERIPRATSCDDDCCSLKADRKPRRKREKGDQPGQQLEHLIEELFRAHDLNEDGLLAESELIKLNEAVAEVHDDTDSDAVRKKYSELFREKLDPKGEPVPYAVFRKYILEMLEDIDRNEDAQELLVEQFVAEARLARTVVTGAPLLVDRPRTKKMDYVSCLHFCPGQ